MEDDWKFKTEPEKASKKLSTRRLRKRA